MLREDRIPDLRRKFAESAEKIDTVLSHALDEARDLTAEEETEISVCEKQKETFKKSIERLQKNDEDRSSVILPDRAPLIRVIREEGEDENGQYKPFRSFGEQLKAVQAAALGNRHIDERLLGINKRAAAGMSEGVGSDGGFLVQIDYSTELLRNAYETGILTSRVRRFPISPNANGLVMNVIDESSRVDGSRWGGVRAYWENEADEGTATKPRFGRLEFRLQKLIGLCYATDELLADASALGSVISQAFTEEFSFKMDDAIINGDGAGKPLGILQSACLVSVAKESSQVATTLVAMNIIKMRSRMWSRSRNNSVWLINQDCEPQLHKLNYKGDGSLSDIPVYLPANGLAGQPYDTLYGRPVLPIEHCATVGSVGDIIYADLSQYGWIDRGGMESASSIHVKFTTDETAFRFVMRVDGQSLWKTATTPFKGSNTQSPFIVTAVRA
jgi:HK97 family phage major capsid protein